MEKWLPIFWIIGGSVAYFGLLLLVDFLKAEAKKRRPAGGKGGKKAVTGWGALSKQFGHGT